MAKYIIITSTQSVKLTVVKAVSSRPRLKFL